VTGFRRRLLIFGYPVLELATFYLVAQLIGWGWTFLLIIVGFPIGFAVMRNAGDAAMADVLESQQTGREVDASRHTLGFVGGLLIMIPGFWSDLVGLLLAVPFTQRLFRSRMRTWFSERFTSVRVPGATYPRGDVIQGTVIHYDGSDPAPPGTPQLPGPDSG
jgi:UPF0716 protein FxsA